MYRMKKLNREKKAATEERRKELEEQGYECIEVMADKETEEPAEEDPADKKPELKGGKAKNQEAAGKEKVQDGKPDWEGGGDGSGVSGKN